MSVTHLVADTYPYSPGTTMRTGNPCATGSAVPFMATASIASRPSRTVAMGVPEVKPSVEVHSNWSAPARGRAVRSRLARLVPSHLALPMYGPATGFDTQHSVIQSSISGRLSSWSKLMLISRSTMPWMRRCQVCGATSGRISAVSTR